ncbi:MAG: hypothetical protein KDJ77_09485 [Rhodobiaceae bacterium]|nr:hypothetical protein [Rhodobiaceae bacterium]
MSGFAKVAVILAVTLSGATISEQLKLFSGNGNSEPTMTRDITDQSRPALLQPTPDKALECQVESERQFEPARRAFVMKKVMICR